MRKGILYDYTLIIIILIILPGEPKLCKRMLQIKALS